MKTCTLAALALAGSLTAHAQEYTLGPDSQPQAGVPKGKVTKYEWNRSKVYPGTTRSYWVYVPAQYDAAKPACVMVFQDGAGFASETGAWRTPVVFDNLIHQGVMPVTIGVFIDPGVLPAASPDRQSRFNRSYEYDGLGDRYARFLVDEILPEVAKQYNLSTNPNDRAISGSSSGGIAAFTAAWERPDAFRRVLSFIGSFTNLRGGDSYINLVRKMEPKPLRVFLQDGINDLNLYSGSWYSANYALAMSLEYAGYDYNYVVGTEAHNSRHGAAILPDALRWLWHDYPQPIAAGKGEAAVERHFITEILDPGSDWELVGDGYQRAEGPAIDRDGNLYFCDADASKIYKVAAGGKPALFKDNTGGARSLMFGPDGRMYVAERQRKRVAVYGRDGKASVLAGTGIDPIDVVVTSKGVVYFTDAEKPGVWAIEPKGAPRLVVENTARNPVGLRVNPDESLLALADHVGRTAWSFRIEPDGALINGEPFYHLELRDDLESPPLRPGSDGMAFDDQGYLYIATNLGIQICDQPGRVVGIIAAPPGPERVTNLVFGGPDLQTIYVTAGSRVYKRHLRRKGVLPWQPVKLPRPQL
ncbi:MAG TPA: SMP-30/gluconolactonase/LRE family protein [Bryobacteraceae bacterium]